MARQPCTVCSHPQRQAIDKLICDATLSVRRTASQFGLIETSIRRHKKNCLDKRVQRAVQKIQEKQGDAFMDGILAGMSAAKRGVDTGMAHAGEIEPELAYRLAPGFLAQQARYLELLGQATGRLNQVSAASNITLSVAIPTLILGAQPQPAIEATPISDADVRNQITDGDDDPKL